MKKRKAGPDWTSYLKYSAFFIAAMALLSGIAFSAYVSVPLSAWRSLDLTNRYIWLPDLAGDFFEGSVISLHFNMMSGDVLDVCGTVLAPDFKGEKDRPAGIFGLSWSICEDPDYDVTMSDSDAFMLATSTTPMRAFSSLEDSGNIKVVPMGNDNAHNYRYAKFNFLIMDGQEVPESIREYFEGYRPEGSG